MSQLPIDARGRLVFSSTPDGLRAAASAMGMMAAPCPIESQAVADRCNELLMLRLGKIDRPFLPIDSIYQINTELGRIPVLADPECVQDWKDMAECTDGVKYKRWQWCAKKALEAE